ncbi:MAG: hypothetical protein ACKN9K_32210, partial [Dolichospermum sp.]
QKSFAIATKSVTFKNPQIPVFSNVNGKYYPQDATAIQKNLESHLASSVLFKQQIEKCMTSFLWGERTVTHRTLVTNKLGSNWQNRPRADRERASEILRL